MIISIFRDYYSSYDDIRRMYHGFDNSIQSNLLDTYPKLIELSKSDYKEKLKLEAYYIWTVYLDDTEKKKFKASYSQLKK